MRLTLATKFMDKLGLPEEHDMLLVLRCFFLKTETKTQVSDFDQTITLLQHKTARESVVTLYENFQRNFICHSLTLLSPLIKILRAKLSI